MINGPEVVMNGGMPRCENYPAQLRHPMRTDPSAHAVMRRDSLSWDDINIRCDPAS